MKPLLILCFVLSLLLTAPACYSEEVRKVPFLPPKGKVLLVIGQDKTSIDEYVRDIGIVPGGTMVYTSIQDVDGLETETDHGGGIHHGQYLLDHYPDSVLQIGLWMVDGLEGVVKGEYDGNIDKMIAWIKKAKRPIYLRIGYEFDLPANHYAPESYRRAFRYIVDRFRQAQVENAAFVWHSYGSLPEYSWMDWYPGDDYVDWFAVTVFGKPNIYHKKFVELARQHHKGFMIAESTPERIGTGHGEESWKNWFEPFFRFIADEKVQIVCYINYDWEAIRMFKGQGFGDARVQANEVVKARWRKEILQKKYLQASPSLFKRLKYKDTGNRTQDIGHKAQEGRTLKGGKCE